MSILLSIFLGGGVGALLRFLISEQTDRLFLSSFPYGTIVVNVLGAFLMGLVFGYFGYLVALGIYERSLQTLFIASLIIFYYGGMIFGILPGEKFISWEAHLFGLFAGVLAARFVAIRYLKENGL